MSARDGIYQDLSDSKAKGWIEESRSSSGCLSLDITRTGMIHAVVEWVCVQPRSRIQMPEFESCLCQPGGMSCRLNKLCRQKCFQQHTAQSELSMCRAYIIIIIASSAHVVMALRLGTITKRAESLFQDLQWMWWLSLGSGFERGRMFSFSVIFMFEFFTITYYFFLNKRKHSR